MLTSKWHTLNANCQKFNAAYKQAKRLGKSGENDVDVMKRAQSIYHDEHKGVAFCQEDAWAILKFHPKWDAPEQELRLKREAAERAFEAQAENDRTLMRIHISTTRAKELQVQKDYELAQKLQAKEQRELTVEERLKMFVELMNKRKKHFAMLRAKEKRIKPPTKSQKRKQKFKEVTEGSSKIAGDELEQEDANRERLEEDNASAELKREDLEVLWSIVKSRFEKIKPVDNMDNLLFQNLKTMFEHHIEDTVWKYQKGLTKVLNWKLFDSCGVYCVTMQNMMYYLLVEKMYPFTKHTLQQLWNDVRLQVDYKVEMAYDLLRLIRKQLREGYGRTVRIKRSHDDLRVIDAQLVLLVYKVTTVFNKVNVASSRVTTAERVTTTGWIYSIQLSLLKGSIKVGTNNEFPAGDEMFLEIDENFFKIHTKGYFEYDPLRVKTNISKRKKTSMIHDDGDDRKKSLVTGGRKGKEKVIDDDGICRKGNKADVSIYKKAMVNGKAKMVEDIGAVKRGKERGVIIKDGGFRNDGGKETVVTKRAIRSRKMEGKSVKAESE
nr:glutathione S-transferase T3-like [Tanacetum cinerariifolium]